MRSVLERLFMAIRKRHIAVAALCIWAILLFSGTFGSFIIPCDPNGIQLQRRLQPPSLVHWFGTDQYGRDVFSRILVGTRLTLGTAICTVITAAGIGVLVGSISGYLRPLGVVLMRIMDAMMAFPNLLVALFLASIMGPGFLSILIAVGVTYIPRVARLMYGVTLEIAANTFVESARAIGVGHFRVLTRYIILNTLSPIIVQSTFYLAESILVITALNFLGAGFRPDIPSWGNMISTSRIYLTRAPWLLIFPGVAIMVSIVATNIIGDALRDALDPRSLL